MVKRHIA